MRMNARQAARATAAAVAATWLATASAAGQPQSAATWTMPRTSWGAPDLQGIWTNATLTPMERPETLEAASVLTAEQAAEFEVQSAENLRVNDRRIPGVVGAYNQFWMDAGTTVVESLRTSLVVDPPDGRIPWSAAGRARLESDSGRYGVGPFDSWVDADTGERCLTDGLPLVPLQGYNMNTHILQAPGWVAILNEMFHEYRIVPVDGRAPVAPAIGQWLGGGNGRWEGDTLVVESTRFAGRGHYLWRATWRAARPTLHLVERFTPRRRTDHRLRVHDDRSGDVHPALDGAGADDDRPCVARRDVGSDVRVRLPRGQLRADEHAPRRPGAGTGIGSHPPALLP